MPELDIRGGYWYVSYDGGKSWERLGRATGYDGSDGKDGQNGQNGDAFFKSVTVNDDYVVFTLADNTTFQVPKYKEFSVALTAPQNYVVVNGSELKIKYVVTNCANPTVLVISDLKTTFDGAFITVKAPTSKTGLDDIETVTVMVSNGQTTIMESVDITVADVVIADANSGGQAALDDALADPNVATILLGSGKYLANLYTGTPARESLTIIGTEGTQFAHTGTSGGQLNLNLFDSFTIRNCEILKREVVDKDWGMLVFSTGKDTGGVYTVDNCTFNGVGTQGVYINEKKSSAVYNITNCTFDGDFGDQGVITIQGNVGVDHTINITGCTFNITSSHKIYFASPGGGNPTHKSTNLHTDNAIAESDIYVKQ